MITETVVLALISAIGGGSLGAYLNFRLKRDENKVNESFNLISHLTEEIDRQKARIVRLEKENEELLLRVRLLETTSEHIPFPMWYKDLYGHYIWVNDNYIDRLLKPQGRSRADIIGKNDDEVWEKDTVDKLKELALRALKSPSKEASISSITFGNSPRYSVYKYPIYVYNTIVGWAGIAITSSDEN